MHATTLGGIALGATLLAGCGFQLRGEATLPADVEAVYVQAPQIIGDEIAVFVESGGAKVVGAPDGAQLRVSVSGELFDRRVLSVDPTTGKEREYELAYTVTYTATRADGTVVAEPQQITLLRDFVFDPSEVIGKSREEVVLYDEMRRDAARQIVRRLEAGLSR